MKTFWGVAVAVVVAVSLTGCGEVAVAEPAGMHMVGRAVERTVTPPPAAPDAVAVPAEVVTAEPVAPAEVPVVASKPRPVTPAVAPAPITQPATPAVPVTPVAPEVAPATPALSPFDEWMANPTFTCDPGQAPGWINEQGVPTSCVAN